MTDSSDRRQTLVLEVGWFAWSLLSRGMRSTYGKRLKILRSDAGYRSWHPRTQGDMKRIVTAPLAERDTGSRLPFAVVDREEGCAIGTTSYLDIEPARRRIEIGWTWFGRRWWGTGRNEESKLLLFRHAFETLKAQRQQRDKRQVTCNCARTRPLIP
jgi:Acetyltransferase (GNAT) domain